MNMSILTHVEEMSKRIEESDECSPLDILLEIEPTHIESIKTRGSVRLGRITSGCEYTVDIIVEPFLVVDNFTDLAAGNFTDFVVGNFTAEAIDVIPMITAKIRGENKEHHFNPTSREDLLKMHILLESITR